MTEREVPKRDATTVSEPADLTRKPTHDPDRHTEVAGLTLVLIIGGIALIMIVVMVVAFMYFQNTTEGPTSLTTPALAVINALVG